MIDAYYEETPIVDALVATLTTALPALDVEKGEGKLTSGQVIVEAFPPAPQFDVGLAGPTRATITVTTTSVGVDRKNAREIGNQVRKTLTGRDWNGSFTTPIVAPGLMVDDVTSERGFPADDGKVFKWIEDYRVDYQAFTAPVLPS